MSRGPPGGDDPARPVIALGRDDKQKTAHRHADDPYPLLPVFPPRIDLLEPVRVLDRCDGIEKIDAVLAAIRGCLRGISFITTVKNISNQ
jgi:hypothetical protein